METTAAALGLDEFNEKIFTEEIVEIQVHHANTLVFVFMDGRVVKRLWSDRSRSESWTDEMKEKARQKANERNRKI